MNLFEVEGTLSALGQSTFNNDVTIYTYVAITDAAGRRTMIEKVAVCNDNGAVLATGQTGRFYIDRLFSGDQPVRCQLWGVRAGDAVVVDRHNLREKAGYYKIVYGIATLPVFGIGLLLLISGIRLLVLDARYDRKKMFWGNQAPLPPPLPVHAVRI